MWGVAVALLVLCALCGRVVAPDVDPSSASSKDKYTNEMCTELQDLLKSKDVTASQACLLLTNTQTSKRCAVAAASLLEGHECPSAEDEHEAAKHDEEPEHVRSTSVLVQHGAEAFPEANGDEVENDGKDDEDDEDDEDNGDDGDNEQQGDDDEQGEQSNDVTHKDNTLLQLEVERLDHDLASLLN